MLYPLQSAEQLTGLKPRQSLHRGPRLASIFGDLFIPNEEAESWLYRLNFIFFPAGTGSCQSLGMLCATVKSNTNMPAGRSGRGGMGTCPPCHRPALGHHVTEWVWHRKPLTHLTGMSCWTMSVPRCTLSRTKSISTLCLPG